MGGRAVLEDPEVSQLMRISHLSLRTRTMDSYEELAHAVYDATSGAVYRRVPRYVLADVPPSPQAAHQSPPQPWTSNAYHPNSVGDVGPSISYNMGAYDGPSSTNGLGDGAGPSNVYQMHDPYSHEPSQLGTQPSPSFFTPAMDEIVSTSGVIPPMAFVQPTRLERQVSPVPWLGDDGQVTQLHDKVEEPPIAQRQGRRNV